MSFFDTHYGTLNPGADSNTNMLGSGRTFSLYWSWITSVEPEKRKAKFPKGHELEDKPVPKRWVRCAMPWASDVYREGVPETPWAPIMAPHPHHDEDGETVDFTPRLNQPVLLGFVGNNYRYPVVLGFIGNHHNEYKTGRADLQYRTTRSGHKFIVDDDAKAKLRKLVWESSMGHTLAFYDEDQGDDPEKELGKHKGKKRSVELKDLKGQGLTLYCPGKPDVPLYVKLQNAESNHVLHMQAGPNKFATFSDSAGQFWKFDTDANSFFIKAGTLIDIKADGDIQITAGGVVTVSARLISLGPGAKLVVLDDDIVVGTITSPHGPCSFSLRVKSSATKVIAI